MYRRDKSRHKQNVTTEKRTLNFFKEFAVKTSRKNSKFHRKTTKTMDEMLEVKIAGDRIIVSRRNFQIILKCEDFNNVKENLILSKKIFKFGHLESVKSLNQKFFYFC